MHSSVNVQYFTLISILGAVSVLQGCVTTHVEFDRMTGTAFPTDQTLDGESWSLADIYIEAGNLVVVDEDDTNIAPIMAGGARQNCISDAELETVETANRSTQVGPATFDCGIGPFQTTCTRYHAYGIVADHIGMCFGTCRSSLLGCMYDTTDRGAFAIYYRNSTISSDGQKYLRTTAHELGHAFNLHHTDGDGSETVMNQTGTVGNTFTYEFTDDSENHLENHDVECRFPGTGAWALVNSEHAGWHGWTADCP